MDGLSLKLRMWTRRVEVARELERAVREKEEDRIVASVTGFDTTSAMFRERRLALQTRIAKAHDRVNAAFDRCDSAAGDYEQIAIQAEREAVAAEAMVNSLSNFRPEDVEKQAGAPGAGAKPPNAGGQTALTPPNSKSGGM